MTHQHLIPPTKHFCLNLLSCFVETLYCTHFLSRQNSNEANLGQIWQTEAKEETNFFRKKPNVWPYLRPQNALCPDIRCCCKINIPHTCRQISLSVKDIRETSNNALHFCETWIKKCRDCSCYVIQLGGGVEVGGFSTKH